MILVRALLIGLIVYLIVRAFIKHGQESGPLGNSAEKENTGTKKISKSIGEYVDYEEVKEDKK